MVRMVAVEDLGQGSEALRILGVRWLPTGGAARSVGSDGNLKSPDEEKGDRTVETSDDDGDGQDDEQQDDMQAEDGDFVNVELAFAYRPSTGKGIKSRAKHAHILLAFYMPGNFKIRKSGLLIKRSAAYVF